MPSAAQGDVSASERFRIHVVGDVNLDSIFVNLTPEAQPAAGGRWPAGSNFWRYRRRGGAWLLKEICQAAFTEIKEVDTRLQGSPEPLVESYRYPDWATDDGLKSILPPECLSSAAILRLFPRVPKKDADDLVYRVEKFLGWIHADANPSGNYGGLIDTLLTKFPPTTSRPSDLLVLHDTGTAFRYRPNISSLLEPFVTKDTWFVWHMYSPLATGVLWDTFEQNDWFDRTVVVVKADSLREIGVYLPENICLEVESHNLIKGLRGVPRLKQLARVRHLVVNFPTQGALHHDRDGGGLKHSCYYCPYVVDAPQSLKHGTMRGFSSVLVATLVRGLTDSLRRGIDESKGIIEAIRQGVVLDRLYYVYGYGEKKDLKPDGLPKPYNKLFEKLAKIEDEAFKKLDANDYTVAALDLPSEGTLPKWTRLDGLVERFTDPSNPNIKKGKKAERVALAIVRRGLKKVVDDDADSSIQLTLVGTPGRILRCPFMRFGEITTAYPKDIDRFSRIRQLLGNYISNRAWTKPLSLLVCGEPGSGKSFTIEELLKSVDPSIATRKLEFNLSQIQARADLVTAFHRIQNEAVTGNVPLVFIDEFDVGQFNWVKEFLAPMQEGTFTAGETTYSIGRAVFVFAGGTVKTWRSLTKLLAPPPQADNPPDRITKIDDKPGPEALPKQLGQQESHRHIIEQKVPDFVSRLNGYLEIQPINPSASCKINAVLIVRRAVMLRSLLERHLKLIINPANDEARFDDDVVRALLNVTKYIHGSRSMRAIIEMSQPTRAGSLQWSSLPPLDQLRMHIEDTRDFRKSMRPWSGKAHRKADG